VCLVSLCCLGCRQQQWKPFGHHCCRRTNLDLIKHRGRHTNINFYFNLQNQLNCFNSSLGTNMHKATLNLGSMDSSNPHHWRGKHLHHHGDGVCWLFVLLWIDLQSHKLIVCKKRYKNNLKMRLTELLFVPHWRAPHHGQLP
jgi:hypothetical protein